SRPAPSVLCHLRSQLFVSTTRCPPRSPLFPSTTLFRSKRPALPAHGRHVAGARLEGAGRPADLARTHLSADPAAARRNLWVPNPDRKSTRLNSSHVKISYAVFCLKKKKHGPADCSTSPP